jgi:hypothetical protein
LLNFQRREVPYDNVKTLVLLPSSTTGFSIFPVRRKRATGKWMKRMILPSVTFNVKISLKFFKFKFTVQYTATSERHVKSNEPVFTF